MANSHFEITNQKIAEWYATPEGRGYEPLLLCWDGSNSAAICRKLEHGAIQYVSRYVKYSGFRAGAIDSAYAQWIDLRWNYPLPHTPPTLTGATKMPAWRDKCVQSIFAVAERRRGGPAEVVTVRYYRTKGDTLRLVLWAGNIFQTATAGGWGYDKLNSAICRAAEKMGFDVPDFYQGLEALDLVEQIALQLVGDGVSITTIK